MADLSKLRFNGTDYNVKDASAPKRKFDNTYAKTGNLPITSNDTTQTAIGKLEKAHDSNQSNILYNMNMGVKNEFPTTVTDSITVQGVTLTNLGNGTYDLTRTSTGSSTATINIGSMPSDYIGYYLTGGVTGYGIAATANTSGMAVSSYDYTTPKEIPSNAGSWFVVQVEPNENPQHVILKPMLCTPEAWAQSTDFKPPALPNSDLTLLESEDRAALAEEIDSGAKNVYNPSRIDNVPTGLTVTRESDGTTLKINGTYSGTGFAYIDVGTFITDKTGVYYLNVISTKTMSEDFIIYTNDGHLAGDSSYNYTTNPYTSVGIKIASGQTFNNDTVKILICTKAAFAVSQKFVPYRMPYADTLSVLDERAPKSTDDTISRGSMDNFDSGCVLCTSNVTGGPTTAYCYVRTRVYDSNCVLQQVFYPSLNTAYQRCKWAGTWSEWKQFVS